MKVAITCDLGVRFLVTLGSSKRNLLQVDSVEGFGPLLGKMTENGTVLLGGVAPLT